MRVIDNLKWAQKTITSSSGVIGWSCDDVQHHVIFYNQSAIKTNADGDDDVVKSLQIKLSTICFRFRQFNQVTSDMYIQIKSSWNLRFVLHLGSIDWCLFVQIITGTSLLEKFTSSWGGMQLESRRTSVGSSRSCMGSSRSCSCRLELYGRQSKRPAMRQQLVPMQQRAMLIQLARFEQFEQQPGSSGPPTSTSTMIGLQSELAQFWPEWTEPEVEFCC